MNMEEMIGGDFEKGLASLNEAAEAEVARDADAEASSDSESEAP
jgi:hypothetical protein